MKIGLTGGIACGKSVVLEMFKEAGWHTLSADALVHELLDHDPEVIEAVISKFGIEVKTSDASLNKKAIAKVVFADSQQREWLEGLLHPLVRKRWTSTLDTEPDKNWVVEIPLLFEKKLEKDFDLVVCLSSSRENQLERLQSRGMNEADAEARIASQAPQAEKIEKSDFVLTNTGSLNFLRKQFQILIESLERAKRNEACQERLRT